MVNGPRPTTIAKPATPATPASFTPASHVSPTLLQRQHTSVYSACSTGTPVLVYGKAATPLAGDWSAEPWDPTRVRPMVLESVLDAGVNATGAVNDADDMYEEVEDNTSSVAETAAFSDDKATAAAVVEPQTTSPTASNSHIAFIYRYDPYSSRTSRRELYRCVCDSCMDGATCGRDAFATTTVHYALPSPSFGMEAYNSDEFTNTHTAEYALTETMSVAPSPAHPAAMAYEAAQYWTASSSEPLAAEPPAQSNFVPPPPPPKVCRGVIAESAEGALDVDAAFYHISMRWYTKVAAVQHKFVRDIDFCPEPEQPGMTFTQWIESVGKWWLRHFENAQRKTSASSGLLRTAMAPVTARLATAGGFESHASVAASFAAHRFALKNGPRRQFGTSGLTASMLESLGGNGARLPTPRSAAKKVEETLPW